MHQNRKVRVAVLYGGRSSEHEISLRSAQNVIEKLDHSRYEVIPVGIDKSGKWSIGHDVFKKSLEVDEVPLIQENGNPWFAPQWISQETEIKHELSSFIDQYSKKAFDVIFPALHGTYCEDGTLQGLLELADIAYVGCGVLSSAINMDKDVAKRLAKEGGVPVVPYVTLKKKTFFAKKDDYLEKIDAKLTYPLFVKPANAGSSVGITKVKNKEALLEAINFAFEFDNKIVVENGVIARELEIAVLESLEKGHDPIVSVVGEIKPHHEFYSYEAKYLDENGASLFIPADLPSEILEAARNIAKQLFLLLECEGMARIDLFYDTNDKTIYFNEVNTIPGFTAISMYPKLMGASGVEYGALLTHLVELALKRHHDNTKLTRNYAAVTS